MRHGAPIVAQVRERQLSFTKVPLAREAARRRPRHIPIRTETKMHSPLLLDELQRKIQDSTSNPPVRAGLNVGIDWRETCWFLKREEDELAGYLFAEDCEMREGSD